MSLRSLLDKQAKHFEPGGKLEKLHALWEASDTILYTPGKVTAGPAHVRDGLDLKRMMMTVVISLVPAILMALYNTGYQAHLAISKGKVEAIVSGSTLYRINITIEPCGRCRRH